MKRHTPNGLFRLQKFVEASSNSTTIKLLKLPKMWRFRCVWKKRLMVLSLVPEPTPRNVQHLKDYPVFRVTVFLRLSSRVEHSLFYDAPDALALKGLSSATHAQPVLEEKLQNRAYPATNLKSARTLIPTNFYVDELIRCEPQIEN